MISSNYFLYSSFKSTIKEPEIVHSIRRAGQGAAEL